MNNPALEPNMPTPVEDKFKTFIDSTDDIPMDVTISFCYITINGVITIERTEIVTDPDLDWFKYGETIQDRIEDRLHPETVNFK